jgi:phospholipase/carboxylesterase
VQPDLEGPSLPALSCGKAAWLVVLLHGVGADGDDLIDLALNWQPIIPKAEFVALHAPFPFDQAPTGRQWFSIADRSPDKILDGIRTAASILDPCLDAMLGKRRLDESHLALVGFSQGAMTALHVGLRRKTAIAGIVAFSGALVAPERLGPEITARPPVLLVHGASDDVVPFAAMTAAKEALKAAEVPVKALRRPGLGHAIDDDGVIAAGDFLTARLVVAKKASADHAH